MSVHRGTKVPRRSEKSAAAAATVCKAPAIAGSAGTAPRATCPCAAAAAMMCVLCVWFLCVGSVFFCFFRAIALSYFGLLGGVYTRLCLPPLRAVGARLCA